MCVTCAGVAGLNEQMSPSATEKRCAKTVAFVNDLSNHESATLAKASTAVQIKKEFSSQWVYVCLLVSPPYTRGVGYTGRLQGS